MRSKEVSKAIDKLTIAQNNLLEATLYSQEEQDEDIKTVLAYIEKIEENENRLSAKLVKRERQIEELEKMIPTPSNEVPVEYQMSIYVDKRYYVSKDKIRDKIKELEEDKQTILQAIEEAKESKDEEFLKYNREILYRINGEIQVLNGEIQVLKELLGE